MVNIHKINLYNVLLKLNDIIKFQNAGSFEDKKLGYMYFIIGLGTVSRPCVETHQWLMYV